MLATGRLGQMDLTLTAAAIAVHPVHHSTTANPLLLVLAGLVAVNELMGAQHRLLLDFPAGYGFMGIAVALMGRNHPLGICLAALFFGALYQGGTELSFEMPKMTRDIVVVIEGLAILFCGALENIFRSRIARWLGSEAAA